jgi:hypothetical protein
VLRAQGSGAQGSGALVIGCSGVRGDRADGVSCWWSAILAKAAGTDRAGSSTPPGNCSRFSLHADLLFIEEWAQAQRTIIVNWNAEVGDPWGNEQLDVKGVVDMANLKRLDQRELFLLES